MALALVASGLAFASTAGAYVTLAPNSQDFGSQQVGTVSAPVTFTLKVTCYPDFANPPLGCNANEPFTPSVSASGDYAVQSNTCTAPMPGDTTYGTTCTFSVVFVPVALGALTGIASSGEPNGFGRSGLTGTGVAPPAPAAPAIAPLQPPQPETAPVTAPGAGKHRCRRRHGHGAPASRTKGRCKRHGKAP